MKRIAFAAALLGAGCALIPTPETPLGPGEVASAPAARGAVVIGKSTKADVRAALGEAIVVDFESGHEVWVYRERLRPREIPPPPELVLLFEPAGVLAKARVR